MNDFIASLDLFLFCTTVVPSSEDMLMTKDEARDVSLDSHVHDDSVLQGPHEEEPPVVAQLVAVSPTL